MSHSRIEFGLDFYNDRLHLIFYDVLGDVDDTFTHSTYADDDDLTEVLTPIPDIYTFLRTLYEKGQQS